jgi:type I restriction enzyme S subunit
MHWCNPQFFYFFTQSQFFKEQLQSKSKSSAQAGVYMADVSALSIVYPKSYGEQQNIAVFLDRETAKIDALIAEQQRLIELLKEKRQALISHAVTKGLNPDAPMKDSGIEWLGEVPEHWGIVKVKQLASRIGSGKTPLGGSETYIDEGVLFLRSQNIHDEGLRIDDVVYISESVDESMAVSRVYNRDILLNITGASIGRSCVVPTEFPPANVNQHVCIIRLSNIQYSSFAGWCFKSATIKTQIDLAQNGAAREGLNFEQISGMLIALPSADEQQAISNFLDRETAKIDVLTAEAQIGITLLQERRTALISAAVTGKIDVRGLVASEPEREVAA